MKKLIMMLTFTFVACASFYANAASGPYTEVVDDVEWSYYTERRDINPSNYYYYAYNVYVADKSTIPERVVIPQFLGGCRVEEIAKRAFEGCSNLLSLTIPNTLKGFGFQAFGGCSNLSAVNVGSLEQWCGLSFSDWEYGKSHNSLGSNPLSNGAGLYTNGVLIVDFVLPTNVFSIAANAFHGCGSLKSVTLHDRIGNIDVGTFANCANLESVIMSNGVRNVAGGYYYPGAFSGCASLTNMVFSTNLTHIGEHAFSKSGLRDIVLPNSLTRLYEDAFGNCRSLTNVVFGTGLSDIRNGVFSQCGLTSVELPSNITSIPGYMFDGCRNLTSVKFSRNLTFVGMSAFRSCYNISEVHIDDLKSWCQINFTWSDEYNNPYNPFTANPLVFGPELYVAGEPTRGALHIPDDVESIAPHSFYGWTNMVSVTFADSVKTIGKEAFACCGVQLVRLGRGIVSMSNGAFEGCECLTEIDFGNFSANIGEGVFSYCENLGDVTIPGTIGKIGDSAFGGCGLTNVTICNGVKDVSSAFSGCYKLAQIAIPDSVTNLASYAFAYCDGLKDVMLGGGIKKIPDGAFTECCNLTNVTMSADVTKIGECSFMNCRKLKDVKIPDGVTDIGYEAFEWCSALESVLIPDSVKSIGDCAFVCCSSMKSLTIGSGVMQIGDWAFGGLDKLEDIIFRGNAPSSMGNGVFEYANESCVAKVLRTSMGWNVEIPGTWNGIRIEYLPVNIPEVAADATADAVTNAIDSVGFADEEAVKAAIGGNAEEYGRFRDWVENTIKDADSIAASRYAAVSYLLGADRLVPDNLASGDVKIESFEPTVEDGKFAFEVSIADVGIGEGVTITETNREAIIGNIKKVLGVEGAARLDESAFSSDNIEITFDAPVDGKARFMVTPPAQDSNSFFLRVKVK